MSKYSIKDFEKGDSVYHLSNPGITMVVIDLNTEVNEVECRWLDKSGKTNVELFMPEELGKKNSTGISGGYHI